MTGSSPSANMSAAVSSNVRPGSPATWSRSTRPAPKSNGSAGVTVSSLTHVGDRRGHQRRLDLPGRPVGCSALQQDRRAGDVRRRHRGAGDGLEVLARRARRRCSSGVGVLPARICTPGAVMSGLMNEPAGPREENAAMTSPWPLAFVAGGERRRRRPGGRSGRPRSRCRRRGARSAASGCRSRRRPGSGCRGSCRRRRPAGR